MKIKWLGNQPSHTAGISWGVPWKKGLLDRQDKIILKDDEGNLVDLQTWPTAYWPDGSVKWTGNSAVIDKNQTSKYFKLQITKSPQRESEGLYIEEKESSISLDTGILSCTILKQGNSLIDHLNIDNERIGTDGKLVVIRENQEENSGRKTIVEERFEGCIESVQIEQSGPIRAVIKIEGIHVNQYNDQFCPFVVRLYFYRNSSEIKIVHTIIYNGRPEADFIKGIGLEFKGHFTGEPWNRNVQVAGDKGMYSEPGQLLLTRRFNYANGLYAEQIANQTIDLNDKELKKHVLDNAKWNDFKLVQDSANSYKLSKRTEKGCSWIDAINGIRSKGLLYAGGVNGGIAVGVKNFWQKYPASLEVNHLTNRESTIRVWMWSPDSHAMDFRHYSKETHVISAYEGFDEMRATAEGIANTSELYIRCFSKRQSSQELYQLACDWQEDSIFVCEPAYYHETEALGIWSLPNMENPFMKRMEKELNKAFNFYRNEIEQRNWYGYWDYGDVMHTYDPVRHQWRYDLGGYAWQNTELVPNIWLWYTFLRTGKIEAFKMAEAMTRHTSEVDRYHIGEYAGLGTRHNVLHWGCGCKEARISMAGLHKFYYYLTTDERTGDLLSNVKDVDFATLSLNPMRAYFPDDNYPTHARVGPDWSAFCSNWLIEWERTENKVYRDKMIKGINIFKKLPNRLLSGPSFGYDPETSELIHMGDGTGSYHMVIAFGAPQIWMEMAHLLEDPEWEDMIVEFGEFYSLSNEEKLTQSNNVLSNRHFHWPMFSAALVAYAAKKKQSDKLAQKAWNLLLDERLSYTPLPIQTKKVESFKELEEIPWVTTNTVSQWCLNLIVCMELIGDMLPKQNNKYVK